MAEKGSFLCRMQSDHSDSWMGILIVEVMLVKRTFRKVVTDSLFFLLLPVGIFGVMVWDIINRLFGRDLHIHSRRFGIDVDVTWQ